MTVKPPLGSSCGGYRSLGPSPDDVLLVPLRLGDEPRWRLQDMEESLMLGRRGLRVKCSLGTPRITFLSNQNPHILGCYAAWHFMETTRRLYPQAPK